MKQIIHEMQDMTYLSWAKTRNSSGIAGSFLKAYEEGTEEKTYYKLSNYDAWKGITGHECVNEIIVDRLLTVLGIEHLSYQLIHALVQIDQKRCETWLCASRNFKRRGESKIALDGCPADKRSAILSQQKSAYATQLLPALFYFTQNLFFTVGKFQTMSSFSIAFFEIIA